MVMMARDFVRSSVCPQNKQPSRSLCDSLVDPLSCGETSTQASSEDEMDTGMEELRVRNTFFEFCFKPATERLASTVPPRRRESPSRTCRPSISHSSSETTSKEVSEQSETLFRWREMQELYGDLENYGQTPSPEGLPVDTVSSREVWSLSRHMGLFHVIMRVMNWSWRVGNTSGAEHPQCMVPLKVHLVSSADSDHKTLGQAIVGLESFIVVRETLPRKGWTSDGCARTSRRSCEFFNAWSVPWPFEGGHSASPSRATQQVSRRRLLSTVPSVERVRLRPAPSAFFGR